MMSRAREGGSSREIRGRSRGVTTMAKRREPWKITPLKKPKNPLPGSLKAEVEAKAADLIELVLKPKHVLPPPKDGQFNYIVDIGARWYRNYFYFLSTYACPGPNAVSPSFESKFVRMEHLGKATFALYFLRHTGEWVGLYDALSVDECLNAIRDDPWFVP
jgi:hypothetical protein